MKKEQAIAMLERLIEMILEKSFQVRGNHPSSYYVNCKPTTLSPEGMYLIGRLILDKMCEKHGAAVDAVGGLITGACPIVSAVAMVSYDKGNPINAFYVRDERKVEGDIHKGDKVIIVDDVITTGDSTIKAINVANEEGLEVLGVIVLVDREEGGKATIEENAPYCESIIEMSYLKMLQQRPLWRNL